MTSKKLTNMAKGTASNDAVIKQQLDTKLSLSGGLMTSNLDMNNNRIYGVQKYSQKINSLINPVEL